MLQSSRPSMPPSQNAGTRARVLLIALALAYAAIGLALVSALLNALFNFCLGCELYLLGKRVLAR